MQVRTKRLTYDLIEQCPEIQSWLDQFKEDRTVAIEMLLRLHFVTRDMYSEWLKRELILRTQQRAAVFSIRKFPKETGCVWDDTGVVHARPAKSLGSEDLVQSVISNVSKSSTGSLFDHPSIEDMRTNRLGNVILVDDSIGSGKRLSGFIQRMMKHKSFLSWWSYAKVRFQVVAFARILEADKAILDSFAGSNHGIRKHPSSTKFEIESHLAYRKNDLNRRWGSSYQRLLDICTQRGIPQNRQRGFGGTMANVVFYHSVPNNIPGVLWFNNNEWSALFPNRSMPSWLPQLFEGKSAKASVNQVEEERMPEVVSILELVKRGVRNENSIAWSIGLDKKAAAALLLKLRAFGLVSCANRITEAGIGFLKKQRLKKQKTNYDRSLYIPESWCAGGETV